VGLYARAFCAAVVLGAPASALMQGSQRVQEMYQKIKLIVFLKMMKEISYNTV